MDYSEMALAISCKYLCVPIWLVCVANCASLTMGQVDCDGSDTEQCDVDYYCDTDYKCKRCALCENFTPTGSCAKTLLECGVCLDGYEFLSIGKCAVRFSETNTVSTVLLLVAAGSISIILIVVVISAILYYIRKKQAKVYSCQNRFGQESGQTSIVAAAPSAPEYPPAPPPYSSYSPQPAFNSLYNESSEPLLKTVNNIREFQMEEQQMANPYSHCVRLPPGSRRYSLQGFDENENFNGNVGVDDNVDNDTEDIINNNDASTARSLSGRVPALEEPSPLAAPDNGIDSLPLHNLCMSTQFRDSDIMEMDSGPDSDHSEGGAASPAPADSGVGSQQVIVQFISNISPVLNLQGNNTRR